MERTEAASSSAISRARLDSNCSRVSRPSRSNSASFLSSSATDTHPPLKVGSLAVSEDATTWLQPPCRYPYKPTVTNHR